MTEPSNEEVVRQYLAAHAAHDYDSVGAMRDPEWTMDWPQTGERVRGHANDRAIMDNWPGGLPTALKIRVVGNEDRWVMAPAFTMHRVAGTQMARPGSRSRSSNSGAASCFERRGTSVRHWSLLPGERDGSSESPDAGDAHTLAP